VFKVIYALYRKDGMSREEFARHWTEVHAPLAARLPNARSYTINPVTAAMQVEGTEADGFAILTFDSAADFEAAAASPEMAAAGEDAALFARHFDVYLVDEHVVR
jgi:uncharacterized protein (TIGR02118 family)